MLVADGFVSGRAGLDAEAICERIERLVAAGVRGVQLRDHGATPEEFETAAEALVPILRARAPDLTLIINGYPALAEAMGAVLHVGHRRLDVSAARRVIGEERLLSYSAHSPTDARRGAEAGADILLVSPLFRTLSHPDQPPGELELVHRTCEALAEIGLPRCVFALGGITPEHVGDCLRAGAHGVAVLSGLLEVADPEQAAHAYLGAFEA